jgi:hypothetical protein
MASIEFAEKEGGDSARLGGAFATPSQRPHGFLRQIYTETTFSPQAVAML